MDLSVISFNCNSIRKNVDVVKDLFKECDILLLQETLIFSDDLDSISNLALDYANAHIPSFDPVLRGEAGRLRGGLSIFWHKRLDKAIAPKIFSEEIMGIKLIVHGVSYLILNIYMPCDDKKADSLIKFRRMCAQLSEIKENENVDNLILAGDFNSDPHKGRFWQELISFIDEENLSIADSKFPYDSFTYFSPAHSSTSWLDHIISNNLNLINNVFIMYGATIFDHIPIKFNLSIPNNLDQSYNSVEPLDPENFVLWPTITNYEKEQYKINCDFDFCNIKENEGLFCRTQNCTLESHKDDLNEAYHFFIESLKRNSDHLTVANRNRKFKIVPGWSENCKQLYDIARKNFLQWKEDGMIRSGLLYDLMKQSRNEFKKAFKRCKKNEERIKNNKLVNSFQRCNKNKFWSEIRKFKKNNTNNLTKIDDCMELSDAVKVFNNKFKSIFDDPSCQNKSA